VLYLVARNKWNAYRYPQLDTIRPHAVYFLADSRKVDESYETVPHNAIYIEDWIDEHGTKKSVVRYEGEEIPRIWRESPFTRNAKTPWVWVGDRDTEIDLTRTFNRFLVVGNRIRPELIKKLTDRTNLIYIESGTFAELKFPGEALIIEEYDDQSVSDSR
jgi:hypothetical protein